MFGLRLLLCLVLCPALAEAGAWTRAEGTGIGIFSSGRRVAPVGALAGGVAEDDSNTSQVFLEYGILDDLTLGGTLFTELSTASFRESSASAGLFLRKRLWQGEAGVFSVQAGYVQPLDGLIGGSFGADTTDSVPEVEARLLYGHGFYGDWGSAFISTEGGYDWRAEGIADEIRLDGTIGYEPWHCCLAILSAFSTVPVQGSGETSLKIAPSLAYTFWPEVLRNAKKPSGPVRPGTIQIGLTYDLLNRNDGLGVQVSIWRWF
ncbi:MAG: hypothetical protein AAGI70_13315 [Pseudomonadota bacterium]